MNEMKQMRQELIRWAGVLCLIMSPHVENAFSADARNTPKVVRTGSIRAPEANQAAAADERFVYAIDSAVIAKYDRFTGQRVATNSGKVKHLNSGFFWKGQMYCAHSNFPRKPERSEIMLLTPETMELTVVKDFGVYRGSLTWVVRDNDYWWCTFAQYGTNNAQTVLVKLDDQWKEHGAWTFPAEVIQKMGNYSISGGLWKNGLLWVTDHDRKVLYRLRLPKEGNVLALVDVVESPFTGQGIAEDLKTGGLVGIERSRHEVVFGEMK
jgi:hypothetical protein